MTFKPKGWDFHCHLDLFQNPDEAFRQCEQLQLFTLTMTTTPQAWKQNMLWAQGNEYVRVGLGLHPELIGQRGNEAEMLLSLLPKTRWVGEIGVDGSPQYRGSYKKQLDIFERIVGECNSLGNKVLSIHSRRAPKSVLEILSAFPKKGDVKYILHWFSGSKVQAKQAIELGCFFSINESMVSNERSLKLLEVIPSDRILIETDEPFRTPQPELRIQQFQRTVSRYAEWIGYSSPVILDTIHKTSLRLLTSP
jgi:TatD DNase family protein